MPLHPLVAPIILRMGGVTEAARKLGCQREAFYQWRRVPAKWVDRVSVVTGIPIAELPKPQSYNRRER